LFVSVDNGGNWQSFQQNLPITPVTDIRIYRDDLVVSTMGRAFWVLDDISALRQSDMPAMGESVVLFEPSQTIRYRHRPSYRGRDPKIIPQYRKPTAIIDYYLPAGVDGAVTLEILDMSGEVVNAFTSIDAPNADDPGVLEQDMAVNEVRYVKQSGLTTEEGINRFHWDMRYTGPWQENEKKRFTGGALAPAGTYTLKLNVGGQEFTQPLTIVMDPRVIENGVTEAHVRAQADLHRKVLDLLDQARRQAHSAAQALEGVGEGDSSARSAAGLTRTA